MHYILLQHVQACREILFILLFLAGGGLQLPEPIWLDKQEEIVAWYEERDLPVPIGGTGFGTTPIHARVARW